MKTAKYKGFRIQDNNGRISIFWLNPTAYRVMSGAYGFNKRGITFKAGQVRSINGAKKVIRDLYERERHVFAVMDRVTARNI